jgi:hypothetical protein
MKILVDIPDRQASFGIEVLHSLSFVKMAKPLSPGAARLRENLAGAFADVRLHQRDKLKLKSARALLDEL